MERQGEEHWTDLLLAIIVHGIFVPLAMMLIAVKSTVDLNMSVRGIRDVREKLGAQWLAPSRPSVRYYYELLVEIRKGDWIHRATRGGPVTLYDQYQPLAQALAELSAVTPDSLHDWYIDLVETCGSLLEESISYTGLGKPKSYPGTVGQLILQQLVRNMARKTATEADAEAYVDSVMLHWPEITGPLRESFQTYCNEELCRYMDRPSRAKSAASMILHY